MRGDDRPRPRPTRRQVITGAGASALALTAGAGFAEPPTVASGHVFHDRGGTGRRRAGDPGIAGVMVSNGRDVVLTDSEGRWRLPVADGDSVFVIKPPHWTTPAGPGGVPRFSHLHRPAGQPEAISPTATPASPPRARCRPPSTFLSAARRRALVSRSLLLADTQPENGAELAYLRDDIIAGALGMRRRVRHQPRRCGVRRSVALSALSADPRRFGHPLASLPRQPRHQLGSPRRRHLARNLEACVRAAPLRLPACRRDVHHAR